MLWLQNAINWFTEIVIQFKINFYEILEKMLQKKIFFFIKFLIIFEKNIHSW